MKPLFKNTTIYNSKNYNQFIKFHGEKFNFSYNMYTFIMLALMLYCIILNIIQKNLLFILFLAMFILTIVFRMILPLKRYQKTKKKLSNNKENKFTFSFYKFYFTVEKKSFSYLKLYKIFETKDYFYLYMDEENAILVSKEGFKLGTTKEFSEFIKKKCLFKYSKES